MWFGEIFVAPTNLYLQVWTPAFANFAVRHDTVFGCYSIMNCALFGCLLSAFVIWTQELILGRCMMNIHCCFRLKWGFPAITKLPSKIQHVQAIIVGGSTLEFGKLFSFDRAIPSHATVFMYAFQYLAGDHWLWPMCEMPAGRLLVKQTGVLFIFTCWDD